MAADSTRAIAEQMIEAASRLIDALDADQIEVACRPFPDDAERRLWFYTPTDHGGLDLGRMTPTQHQLVHRLVATGLSKAGYVTAATIMGLENILDRVENWPPGRSRERRRDPLLYYVTIFGEPGRAGAWSWRFGGHHVSLHHLIVDGEVLASTPNFFGANPADSPLLGPHLHRPLAAIEDLGRELFRSLDGDRRQQALLAVTAPSDLITGNRAIVTEGDRELVAAGHRAGDVSLPTEGKADGLRFTRKPAGILAPALNDGETEILRTLIGCYLDRLPDALADRQAALVDHEFEKIAFAWAGGDERHQPHYYRIQGDRLFIEYDNTQNDANHIHAVWRDLANDFGGDVLARHYADHTHHD
ncbi:MAG: DUF3500 domain-containing protein [Alphaproteobacteria bacterium]